MMNRSVNHTFRGLEFEPERREPLSKRAIAWRIVGLLAIAGAFYEASVLASHPEARDAINRMGHFRRGAPATATEDPSGE